MQASSLSIRFIFKPVVLSIQIALSSAILLTATATHAATPSSIQYMIGAGDLAQALNQFAVQSGVAISTEIHQLEGLKTHGLNGQYTVDQGFTQLLQDTGYQAQHTQEGYILIKKNTVPSQSRDMGRLNTIDVVTTANSGNRAINDPDAVQLPVITVTAINEGYAQQNINSKYGTNLKEVPHSITVISHKNMEDQNLNDLKDVLNKTTGITLSTQDFSTTQFLSRGFEIERIQVDGGAPMNSRVGYAGALGGSISMSQYEQIEVLRGADGIFSGAGEPGGVINLVRKRPLDIPATEFTIQAGQWNNYRTEIDISRPLAFDEQVRGRFVASYQDKEFFYDIADSKSLNLYGVLDGKLSDSTYLLAGISYQDNDDSPFSLGLPRYINGNEIDFPRSRSFTAPWNKFDTERTQFFATLEQQLTDNWTVKANVLYQKIDNDIKAVWGSGAVDPETQMGFRWGASQIDNQSKDFSFDVVVDGKFDLASRTHKIKFGADYRKNDASIAYGTEFFGAFNQEIDINAPQYPSELPKATRDQFYDPLKTTQKGFFTSLDIQLFDKLNTIVGGRYADYSYSLSPYGVWGGSTTKYKEQGIFTPYAGLVYKVNDSWSSYISLSEAYVPQGDRLQGPLPGTPLDPITGDNYEIGLKGELYDGKLNSNFSIYRIEREGQAVRDTNYPVIRGSTCCYIPQGNQISEGFDIELSGEVFSNLELFAGYTYNRNKDKQTNTNRFSTITPKHLLKLFAVYHLHDSLENLRVGGGVTAQSSQFNRGSVSSWNEITQDWTGASVPYEFNQSGYAVWNLFGEYKIDQNWTASLNLNNIFDKKYYQTVGSTSGGNYYGEPRNFMLTLRAKF